MQRPADEDSSVVGHAGVSAFEQLVAPESARCHHDVGHIPALCVCAGCPLLNVGGNEELDLKRPAAQVALDHCSHCRHRLEEMAQASPL